ncbi:hypothetical protein D3C75_496870 [compost metagenome]
MCGTLRFVTIIRREVARRIGGSKLQLRIWPSRVGVENVAIGGKLHARGKNRTEGVTHADFVSLPLEDRKRILRPRRITVPITLRPVIAGTRNLSCPITKTTIDLIITRGSVTMVFGDCIVIAIPVL